MLVKESSDLALQLSCVAQLAHGNGVFKEFMLDIRRQIVPLHDDCGAQTPQNMLLFLGEGSHVVASFLRCALCSAALVIPSCGGRLPRMTDAVETAYFGLEGRTYLRAAKLRALAVTTTTRSDVLPDVPTVDEFIPGYEASAWYGIGAPRGTSTEIIDRLNSAINACLADLTLKTRLAEVGGIPFLSSPTDFDHFIAAETEKWAKVIKSAGIKQE
jgi:hypothetical protein